MTTSISDKHRENPRGTEAEMTLMQAYIDVFGGNATREQADIVLVDLAKEAGWNGVTPSRMDPEERAYAEGRRSLFAVIFTQLHRNADEIHALGTAARKERMIDTGELTYDSY